MKTAEQFEREIFSKRPGVKKVFDALEPEFRLVELMIRQRLLRGLTQKQLAKQLGTKQSAISRFESGTYNPTLEWMRNMARALDAELKITITSNK